MRLCGLFIKIKKAKIRQKPLFLLSEFSAVFIYKLLHFSDNLSICIGSCDYEERFHSSFII